MEIPRVLMPAACLSLLVFTAEAVRSQTVPSKAVQSVKSPKAPASPHAAKNPQPRLPQYYAQIGLTDAQRNQIYAVQARFRDDIQALEKRLALVRQRRDREIQSLLSREQKLKLDELVAAAKGEGAEPESTDPASVDGK
jgi:Spy/CpxP family protein refolding chaperone